MMAVNVRSSVVMATNSGFNGESVNKSLSDAVKTLSKNEAIAQADERVLSASIDSIKPTAKTAGQETNQGLPMSKRDSGRGM